MTTRYKKKYSETIDFVERKYYNNENDKISVIRNKKDFMKIEIFIRKIRNMQKITLKQLSKKSGVSTSHINDIEKNLKKPSLFTMVKIAKALNVDIKELYKVKW